MDTIKSMILGLLFLLALPSVSLASGEHTHEQGLRPTDSTKQQDATAGGAMAIVGTMTSKGVKGMAHIMDVSEVMAKIGYKTPHHFMIAFANENTGEQLTQGTVVLKLTNPDYKVSDELELKEMDGHFGVDLVLDMDGEYHFQLGVKLADGFQRKYHFHFVNQGTPSM